LIKDKKLFLINFERKIKEYLKIEDWVLGWSGTK